jgi:predicted DNA-binding antitoxin AbrB/MazE fold protein
MSKSIQAVFKDGVFVPASLPDFPDGSSVQLEVKLNSSSEKSIIGASPITEFLRRTGERVISDDAPKKIAREDLHERG